jgi:hypothetical protein
MSNCAAPISRRHTLTILLLSACGYAEASPSATQLMKLNFLATKVTGFSGKVKMTLTNSQGEKRIRIMGVQTRLRGNGIDSAVLTSFMQPGDIKGTGFLQIENSAANDDIWVYLPALGKTRRLAANNKRDSFFGTDFSYGDILLPPVEKYEHQWLRKETLDGVICDVIESKPIDAQTQNDTGYKRRVTWLNASNQVELKVDYFDVEDKLLKTQSISMLKELDPQKGRWLAMNREMINHQTGHKTTYAFEQAVLRTDLSDADFSVRKLEIQ